MDRKKQGHAHTHTTVGLGYCLAFGLVAPLSDVLFICFFLIAPASIQHQAQRLKEEDRDTICKPNAIVVIKAS